MKKIKQSQLKLLKDEPKAYGGDLFKTRKGRSRGRPLDTKHSMHFVLRSSHATGAWSFWRHKAKIRFIIEKFATKNGVRLLSFANVGNHLHIQLQLTNRHTYRRFIRAISAAIMMQITGVSRWTKIQIRKKFWDSRPYSRVVIGYRAVLRLRDYIAVNQWEGMGYKRDRARFYMAWNKAMLSNNSS